VVFLRSLPAVRSELPSANIPFLIARLIQAVQQPVTEPVPEPDTSSPARLGAYLAKMGTCTDCHTPRNPKFQPIPGMEMAGSSPMAFGEKAASANLTPDASGIGYYDDALFIQAMRTGHVRARKLAGSMALVGLSKNDGRGPEGGVRQSAHSQAGASPGGQHGATYAVQTLWPKTRTGRSQPGSTLRVMNFRYSAEEAPKSLHTKDPRDPPDHGYLDYFCLAEERSCGRIENVVDFSRVFVGAGE
jgi:hypothetical protein